MEMAPMGSDGLEVVRVTSNGRRCHSMHWCRLGSIVLLKNQPDIADAGSNLGQPPRRVARFEERRRAEIPRGRCWILRRTDLASLICSTGIACTAVW